MQSPKDVVSYFLKAYFEGDGSISFSRKMVELSCCSISEKLIDVLQVVLLRFGIDATKDLIPTGRHGNFTLEEIEMSFDSIKKLVSSPCIKQKN